MQHIKVYYNKVEDVLKKRTKGKRKMTGNKGLLAPSTESMPTAKNERQQIDVIADIVEGIRQAREEVLNAKK